MGLKTQLDEARQQWHTAKNAHLRQIELMEVISDPFQLHSYFFTNWLIALLKE